MLKDQTPDSGVVGACAMAIVLFLFSFVVMLIPVFVALWMFGDWSLASKYVMPASVTVAVLMAVGVSSVQTTSREMKTKLSVFVLAACGLFIYFAFITSVEFGSTAKEAEPAQQLTEADRARIRLDDECRVIGMQYARAASESFNGVSSGRDVVIPSKCRGRAATQEGMRLAR